MVAGPRTPAKNGRESEGARRQQPRCDATGAGANCKALGRCGAMNVPRALRIVLWPLSLVYGAAARLRAWMYVNGWLKQERLKGIVISVGNMTVGGTGKTPMVVWLADKFFAGGKSVAVLSHGYRGSSGTSDVIESIDTRRVGPAL